jgi:hypothetical protein
VIWNKLACAWGERYTELVLDKLSPTRVKRLGVQGYLAYTNEQLAELSLAIRLPYGLCAVIAAAGVVTTNIPILTVLMVLALLGAALPNHPFDYLYNFCLRHLLKRPLLPPRTAQTRFACIVATIWLAITIGLFSRDMVVIGTIWGGILVAIATLVSLTDICIPSMIYNYFRRILFER